MITLTLQQSLNLLKPRILRTYFKNNFQIYCRTQTPCLHCGEPVYVPYTTTNLDSIFCDECKEEFRRKRTIVQYYYMKHVKDQQLKVTSMRLNESNKSHVGLPSHIPQTVDFDAPLIRRVVVNKPTRFLEPQNTPLAPTEPQIDFLDSF